jgi:hypothetical protein
MRRGGRNFANSFGTLVDIDVEDFASDTVLIRIVGGPSAGNPDGYRALMLTELEAENLLEALEEWKAS